jgi:hypothetical protein
VLSSKNEINLFGDRRSRASDSIELLLKISEGKKWSFGLSSDIKFDLMCKFVPTCHQLLSLQSKYVGSDHPDIARTSLDFAMGINGLLTHKPQRLFDLKLENLDSFYKCSHEENTYRREYHRIRDLYPFDAELKMIKS